MSSLILYAAISLAAYWAGTTDAQVVGPVDCRVVLCLAVFPEDCEDDETYVPSDVKAGRCCNACVKNCVKPERVDCRLVRCANAEPSDCQEDERFVRRNPLKGICCDRCVKVEEIVPCKRCYN